MPPIRLSPSPVSACIGVYRSPFPDRTEADAIPPQRKRVLTIDTRAVDFRVLPCIPWAAPSPVGGVPTEGAEGRGEEKRLNHEWTRMHTNRRGAEFMTTDEHGSTRMGRRGRERGRKVEGLWFVLPGDWADFELGALVATPSPRASVPSVGRPFPGRRNAHGRRGRAQKSPF